MQNDEKFFKLDSYLEIVKKFIEISFIDDALFSGDGSKFREINFEFEKFVEKGRKKNNNNEKTRLIIRILLRCENLIREIKKKF